MSNILEFLTVIVRKIETFLMYFVDRFIANYLDLGQAGRVGVIIFLVLNFLFVWYVAVLILRVGFKYNVKNLRNVRTEFQIVLNRAEGKKDSFIHEILLFQKVVIIDEKVIQRAPLIADEPKKIKVKKKKKERVKDRIPDSMPLLDPGEDVYVLDFIKLNRRMVASTFFIVVTIITMFFTKYHDFDVIFRGMYMMRFENYDFIENFGSWLFIGGYAVSILMTLFIWIYFYTRGSWQDKLNMRWIYDTFDIISIIPVFVAILTTMNAFVISPATVTQTSMEPNYYEGDRIFVMHRAEYKQFNVVVVRAGEAEYNPSTGLYSMNQYYIKRIIGLPGDTVTITSGVVYVNGILVDDSDYLKLNTNTYCDIGPNQDVDEECTFVVPDREYFVLGDNRSSSLDSRQLGTFTEDELYGVVIFKVG